MISQSKALRIAVVSAPEQRLWDECEAFLSAVLSSEPRGRATEDNLNLRGSPFESSAAGMAQKKGMKPVKERAVAAFSREKGLMAQKGNTHGKGRLSTTCSHLSLKLAARLSTREIKILEKE